MADRPDPYVSLRNRAFLWYVASMVATTLGTMIQGTVVAWQVYALTRDPLSLGLVGLAEALPFIGLALYAGHLADRHDRKLLALLAIGTQTLAGTVLLAFTEWPGALAGGRVWPIYAVVFGSGVARSFLQPARNAMGAEIVPRETYANAVAWRSSLWQLAAVLGPALGGILYGFSGARAAMRSRRSSAWPVFSSFPVSPTRPGHAPPGKGPSARTSRWESASCSPSRSSWARSFSTSFRCSLAARRLSSPFLRPRSCVPGRKAWASCAPRPRRAPS